MNENRDWCEFPNCTSPDDLVGICDVCGIDVCEHHAVILADDDWRCWACAEPNAESRVRTIPTVAAMLIVVALGAVFLLVPHKTIGKITSPVTSKPAYTDYDRPYDAVQSVLEDLRACKSVYIQSEQEDFSVFIKRIPTNAVHPCVIFKKSKQYIEQGTSIFPTFKNGAAFMGGSFSFIEEKK